MLDNAPVLSHKHGALTIEGYSRAAVQSYWRIPELRIGFDLGAQPWDFMGTPSVAITHAHLDHIAALPVYVARRRMMKMEPPTIYLPERVVRPVQSLLKTVSHLDRGRLPAELVPVKPGDEIELSRELVMTIHRTYHTVPSVGYLVWERRRKLKPEYHNLSQDEIRDLRLSGVEITHEIRIPIVAYTGDTSPEGLDANPELLQAKILITEMTYVAAKHRKDKIHKHGHMHLDDFVERQSQFQNELIIAGHMSMRYSAAQVERMIRKRIPDMLGGRLKVWL